MPYAPIYLSPAPPPQPAVFAAERAILRAEGPYHVGECYYAAESDAALRRRQLAERIVATAERLVSQQACIAATGAPAESVIPLQRVA
jgi:hypothetical protein